MLFTLSLAASQYLKDFYNIGNDINKCDSFDIIYNEMCQGLENLNNSMNQYFLKDWFMML